MKRVIAGLLLIGVMLALNACVPAANAIAPQCPKGYDCTRLETGWVVVADSQKPGFVIGSSADITGVASVAPCRFRPVTAGDRRALECNAPNRVTLDTKGQIQVLLLEKPPITGSP